MQQQFGRGLGKASSWKQHQPSIQPSEANEALRFNWLLTTPILGVSAMHFEACRIIQNEVQAHPSWFLGATCTNAQHDAKFAKTTRWLVKLLSIPSNKNIKFTTLTLARIRRKNNREREDLDWTRYFQVQCQAWFKFRNTFLKLTLTYFLRSHQIMNGGAEDFYPYTEILHTLSCSLFSGQARCLQWTISRQAYLLSGLLAYEYLNQMLFLLSLTLNISNLAHFPKSSGNDAKYAGKVTFPVQN